MSDYHLRLAGRAVDGTVMAATPEDDRREREVARRLEVAWGCVLHRLPHLNPIDYYAETSQRLSAHVEIKVRSHTPTKYPTVFLNVRKYLNLLNAYLFTGVPSYFAVGFSDGQIGWISVADVVPGPVIRMAGTQRAARLASDYEPVIDVSVASLTFLDEKEAS